ncbi:MAG: NUDIX domain-containing protein [Anaerolineae bacterium]|nr:NUDIX domain-containing protein [Anaerolineae bacterium]
MVQFIHGERIGRLGRIAVGCSAAILDPTGTKILLVHRADNNRWAVPGGFMEPGESAAEASAREVLEETGLQVRVGRLIAVYSNPNILLEYPDGNRYQIIALYFAAEPVGGELRPSSETTEVGYFSQDEIERLEMGRFDRQRVADAFARQEAAFIRDSWF